MDWLTQGGEMGKRIQGYDWASTPMGPIEQWPQSVKTAVDIMLANPQSVLVYLGPNQLMLFNDACFPILGDKQDWALGKPFREVFVEVWKDFRSVMNDLMIGKSFYVENQALPIFGRPSRPIGWFTYSYTPLRDESGRVQGIFCVATETTEKVIADEALIDSMDEGFVVFQTLYEDGQAFDFRYLATNAAFEAQTGLAGVVGHTLKEVLPGLESEWIEIFRQVMSSGRGTRFTQEVATQGKWYDCYAFRYGAEDSTRLGLLFRDVTQARLIGLELANISRRKDEFLAMLAHELRNPLAPIAAGASLLEMVSGDAERVKKTGAVIARQVSHMTGLVDDLLDVSRVTRGEVSLNLSAVDVHQVLFDSVEQVRPILKARRHELSLDISPQSALVHGDFKRLVQAFGNLVSNAAKYTPDGGRIAVSMVVEQETIEVSVTDTGQGMSPELLRQCFELFVQGERTSERTGGGLGIGLALVRSIAQLHKGSVHAESSGVGKGSRFSVSLPRAFRQQEDSLDLSRAAEQQQHARERLKVLLVDDNEDAVQMLGMLIEAMGYEVVIDYHPIAALKRIDQEKPDICLFDIGMSEMDGYELAKAIRMSPTLGRLTLVAVTGYGQPEDRRKALQAGFDEHFTKPVDTSALAGLLAKHQRLKCVAD
jgi:signal transduction histidine kinase/CheY-like chemotaxis protein